MKRLALALALLTTTLATVAFARTTPAPEAQLADAEKQVQHAVDARLHLLLAARAGR